MGTDAEFELRVRRMTMGELADQKEAIARKWHDAHRASLRGRRSSLEQGYLNYLERSLEVVSDEMRTRR